MTITADAVGSPQSVSLAGTRTVPAVTLAPTNLAFGTQRLSTTSPAQTVTLTNSGTATLSITSIARVRARKGDAGDAEGGRAAVGQGHGLRGAGGAEARSAQGQCGGCEGTR